MKINILLIVACTFFLQNAYSLDINDSLAKLKVKAPLINEVITISPVEKHHFNLEAPQNCSEKIGSSSIDPSASSITCQFHKPGEHKVTVSVCDDTKKYCKQEYFKVNVANKNSGVSKIANSPISETLDSQKILKKIILPGFHVVSPSEAKKLLTKKHNGILVLVSAEWCPPCNQNKEFLFPQKRFQKSSENLLKIYVDGDTELIKAWKKYFDFKYYPSFVFLNKDFQLIDIRISDTDTYNFNNWVLDYEKNKNNPINEVIKRREARSKGSLFQKAKDFAGNKNKTSDNARLINYYEHIYDFAKIYPLLNKKDAKINLYNISYLDYLNEIKTELLTEKQNEGIKKAIKDQTLLILNNKPQDYINYQELLRSECDFSGKIKLKEKECIAFINKYILSLSITRNKDQELLTEVDQAVRSAIYHSGLYQIEKIKKDKSKIELLSKNCFDSYGLLKGLSPLKNKSRHTKTRQMRCLSEKQLSKSGLNLIDELIKDYPHEELYYRKKAQILKTSKKFKPALEAINKSIKYSYGKLVYYNTVTKAKLLKELGKVDTAKKLLNGLLQGIELKKGDDSNQRMVSYIRTSMEGLTKKKTP